MWEQLGTGRAKPHTQSASSSVGPLNDPTPPRSSSNAPATWRQGLLSPLVVEETKAQRGVRGL